MKFTDAEKQQCAAREARIRQHVYKRNVKAGKMSPLHAQREIALMEEIADDYEQRARDGRGNG